MLEGFFPVRISTLHPEKILPLDIFLPVNNKAIRYAAQGQKIGRDRLSRLRGHLLNKVLIRSEDESLYRVFLEEIMKEAEENKKIALSERTQTMAAGAEAAATDLIQAPQNESVYTRASAQLERLGNFLKAYEGSFFELFKLSGSKENDWVFHGSQIAALAYLLCEEMNLSKAGQLTKAFMTGCFIHDISLEQSGLPQIASQDLSSEQQAIWKQHPVEGAKLLGDKNYVDRLVVDIVMQHEEIPNGSGFPKGLTGSQMEPLVVAVSLANNFDHFSVRFRGDKHAAIKAYMLEELGKYDFDLVQKLQKIVSKLG